MILTTGTLVFFLIVAVFALGIGIFSSKNEVYMLGVVLLLFLGLWTLQEGISQQDGSIVTESGGTTTIVNTYDESTSVWTNGFGLLMIVVAAGLFLHFYSGRQEEKKRMRESVDLDE